MSNLLEIQEAVTRLPHNEKKTLQVWLNSQNDLELSASEEERLLRSLDEAMSDVDSGKGISIHEIRQRINVWAAK